MLLSFLFFGGFFDEKDLKVIPRKETEIKSVIIKVDTRLQMLTPSHTDTPPQTF